MNTVVCVLRSGGDFDESWVYALLEGVREHAAPGTGFVCLTDVGAIDGVETVPLLHHWPGWWSKLELFRPDLRSLFAEVTHKGPVLFMDLDTLPVGPLDPFFEYGGEFAMIQEFYGRRGRFQSGVMMFRPGVVTRRIWDAWQPQAADHVARFRGDGEWLDRHTKPDNLFELFPDLIRSYKVHSKDGCPEGASLVCGHGRPRFTDQQAGWAHELWKERAEL